MSVESNVSVASLRDVMFWFHSLFPVRLHVMFREAL